MIKRKKKVKRKSESSLIRKGLAFAGVFAFVSVGMNLSFLWANTSVFYPAVCLGDWEQPQLAQGELELGVDDPVEAFNDANSAVLRRETGGQIFCGEFRGEWPENVAVRDVKLRLSLAVISSPELQELEVEIVPPAQDEQVPEPSEPESVQEADEQPVEDSVPPSEETSFIQKTFLNIFQQAVAQEEMQVEGLQFEEAVGDIEEDFLEVSYSLGGSEWMPLAKMNHGNWSHLTIFLPDITSLLDIANLKVRLESLPTTNGVPLVYLDGMEVEVEFEQPPAAEDRPVLRLEDSSLLFSGASPDFSINQQPIFKIREPSFTIAEVEQLLQEKKISVLSDRKGRFGESIFESESIQEEDELSVEAMADEEAAEEQELPVLDSFFDPLKEIAEDITASFLENGESSGEEPAEAQPIPLLEPTVEIPIQDGPADEGPLVPDEVEGVEDPISPPEEVVPEADEESSPVSDTVEDLSRALQNLFSYVPGFVNAQGQRGGAQNVKAIVRNQDGDEHSVGTTVDSVLEKGEKKFQIRVERAARGFRPGRYTLEVQVETEDLVVVAEQDFTWGVLAINVNKSIYLPGETAYLQMGVVDEAGNTVCDAKLDLNITRADSLREPEGSSEPRTAGVVAHLSTADGTIEYSNECSSSAVTSKPDYFGYANLPEGPGEYLMELRAATSNGEHIITDSFQAQESVPFDVERFGPSRIYPPADYEVKLKIVPAEDFTGQVVETVPLEFAVMQDTRYTIQDTNSKQIVWEADWKAGETYELEYTFKAPDTSPYKWLLGPLEFHGSSDFAEIRSWQIAADAPKEAFHIYIAQWEWFCELPEGVSEEFCVWRAPGGSAIGTLDLRPLSAQAKAGGIPEGYGVFAYTSEQLIAGASYFGTDLQRELTSIEKESLKISFGLADISSATPTEFLWDMLTKYADPAGLTSPKPLQGEVGQEVILYLAGEPVGREYFTPAHQQRAVATFQADYERNKTSLPRESMEKWTGATMQDLYGRQDDETSRKVLPVRFSNDGWREPSTTIVESFNTADSDTLGPDLVWTEYINAGAGDAFDIVTNKASAQDTQQSSTMAVAGTDLSSDDHYAQGACEVTTGTVAKCGVTARASASANTAYVGAYKNNATDSYEIGKVVAGTFTSLGTLSVVAPGVGPIALRIEANNSDLSLLANGIPRVYVTDTSITGNTRVGIYANEDGVNRIKVDNFEASDFTLNQSIVSQRVDTFTSSSSWVAPTSTSSVDVETWGAGGGATNAVGGGGGGAYAASSSIPVDAGDSYPIVVGTSAVNADGASSTFAAGSSTIEIIAEGGLSGGNGGTGGTAASSTGATKFSGGNGSVGAPQGGGGGAGDSENGDNNSGIGLASGGEVNGGYGGEPGDTGGVPGGGGAESTTDRAGGIGEVRITYNQGTPDNYAYITDRSYNRTTANGTSHTITMPSGIVADDLLIAVFTNDGTATSSPSAGWTTLGNAESDANQQAVYYKVAAGSDTLTVTTSASEASSHIVFLIKNGGTPTATVASSTVTTNANPPSHNAGSSAKYLWITTGGWDGGAPSGQWNISSAPPDYTDFLGQPQVIISGSTAGVTSAVSNRYSERQTEDPGTWTSASESWVSFTIAVPFSAPAADSTAANRPQVIIIDD